MRSLVAILVIFTLAHAYPSGPGAASCQNGFKPEHGVDPQPPLTKEGDRTCPYTIFLNTLFFTPGQNFTGKYRHTSVSILLIPVRGLCSTFLIPVGGRGVCFLVNRETLLELRSKLRLTSLPASTINSSRVRTHNSLSANRAFHPL